MKPGRTRLRIGVAVSRDSVTAVVTGTAAPLTMEEPIVAGGNDVEGVGAAFGALARRITEEVGDQARGAKASIALLPPHCDTRLVQLPPVRPGEAVQVLRRDAARYFVGGASAKVVAVMPGVSGENEKTRPFLAAAASVPLLESIAGMVRAAGWTLARVVPAQAAWIAGATPPDQPAKGRRLVVAADTDTVHVTLLNGGVRDLRRVPAAWPDELAAAAGSGPGVATVHADGARRDRITRVLAAAGWSMADRGLERSASSAAASFAAAAPMELAPPSLILERQRRDRGLAGRAAAVAVLLLAGVAALELWGVQRELASVQARRAEIRSEVEPLIAVRDSLARLEAWSARIESLDQASPRWSRALFDIAMLLPEDAHLVILQTSGDTLQAEVVGAKAGEALQALRPATSLSGIRMEGVVERDLEGGTTATERFRFTARLTSPKDIEDVGASRGDAREVARRQP